MRQSRLLCSVGAVAFVAMVFYLRERRSLNFPSLSSPRLRNAVTADANPTSAGPAPDNPGSFCIVTADCPGLWTIVDNPTQYSVAKNCPGLKRTCEKFTLQVAPVGIQMPSDFEAVYADAKKRNPVIGTQVKNNLRPGILEVLSLTTLLFRVIGPCIRTKWRMWWHSFGPKIVLLSGELAPRRWYFQLLCLTIYQLSMGNGECCPLLVVHTSI
jgi:hypothetical protein